MKTSRIVRKRLRKHRVRAYENGDCKVVVLTLCKASRKARRVFNRY